MGFGYSQILAVIFKIASICTPIKIPSLKLDGINFNFWNYKTQTFQYYQVLGDSTGKPNWSRDAFDCVYKNTLKLIKEEGPVYDRSTPRELIILEEPETNLHPKLQSMLADMLIDATHRFNVNFMVETHSEYLIRKLQFNVATKQIDPNLINLYYLNPATENTTPEEQCYKIDIRPDGTLSREFGEGFLDETSMLMMGLVTGNYRK
ncbi:AAA family ATPase [Persicobacter psychrovividus]|uniref:Endonuclease GajA/Old nuclease/RecF-like AAA domain-containing protein n=1 Tax=Persicobacter psychrovividus TaxID=387638 RepID=A0ABM7VM53_9BACT|nr:hypothetical protein PEPS_43690 [Persicobacter psychrovividus]